VDLTIDGADEVDPELNLIKGGGGRCYTRNRGPGQSPEIIIVDEGSCRRFLAPTGRCRSRSSRWGALPEALPRILGAHVTVRQQRDGTPFRTDQGNLILDCAFGPIRNRRS